MGGSARQIHEPGNDRAFERSSHRQAASRDGSLIDPAPPVITMASSLLQHAPGHDLFAFTTIAIGSAGTKVDVFLVGQAKWLRALKEANIMALDVVSQSRCFDGTQFTYRHRSSETGTAMQFA